MEKSTLPGGIVGDAAYSIINVIRRLKSIQQDQYNTGQLEPLANDLWKAAQTLIQLQLAYCYVDAQKLIAAKDVEGLSKMCLMVSSGIPKELLPLPPDLEFLGLDELLAPFAEKKVPSQPPKVGDVPLSEPVTVGPPLSIWQRAVLDFITIEHRRTGIAPTADEIAKGLKLCSPRVAKFHITALVKKGYVTLRRPARNP